MRFVTTIIVLLIVLTGCDMPNSKNINYPEEEAWSSCRCADTIETGSKIKKFKGIVTGRSTKYEAITDAEENAIGDRSHLASLRRKKFVLSNNTVVLKHLEELLADLVAVRQNPSTIKYSIHLVENKKISGSIAGGHIYITTGLYNKCKGNDDLLYVLIGHEIGHVERGHGKFAILERMVFNCLPKKDSTSDDDFQPISSSSANQKAELEADYYGINLASRLHIDVCAVISFWNEMGKQQNRLDIAENLLSSHPLYCIRASCLREHLRQNFGTACDEK